MYLLTQNDKVNSEEIGVVHTSGVHTRALNFEVIVQSTCPYKIHCYWSFKSTAFDVTKSLINQKNRPESRKHWAIPLSEEEEYVYGIHATKRPGCVVHT